MRIYFIWCTVLVSCLHSTLYYCSCKQYTLYYSSCKQSTLYYCSCIQSTLYYCSCLQSTLYYCSCKQCRYGNLNDWRSIKFTVFWLFTKYSTIEKNSAAIQYLWYNNKRINLLSLTVLSERQYFRLAVVNTKTFIRKHCTTMFICQTVLFIIVNSKCCSK